MPEVEWKGNITAGFNSTNGNSYNEQDNISINAVRRSKKTRLRFGGIYLAACDEDSSTGDKKTTEENFTLKSKYDYFFSRKMFAYLSGSLKKDHIADLDYRTIYGSGLGYQWIEDESLKFSTAAGLALLKEKYTSKINGTFQVTRSDNLSLQFGYNYLWKPNQNMVVLSNLSYTPAIDDFSDYFLTFDTELRVSITKSFHTSFKYILDYDSEPGDDSG
jgi:putative salt-induced outer membrane protein YdiY